jgi:hypothetical protein
VYYKLSEYMQSLYLGKFISFPSYQMCACFAGGKLTTKQCGVLACVIQVAAIEAGTREPAQERTVAEHDLVQHYIEAVDLSPASGAGINTRVVVERPSREPAAPEPPQPPAEHLPSILSRFRRAARFPWAFLRKARKPSVQVCAVSCRHMTDLAALRFSSDEFCT